MKFGKPAGVMDVQINDEFQIFNSSILLVTQFKFHKKKKKNTFSYNNACKNC
jgi:hypothetical protein